MVKKDFANVVKELIETEYAEATRLHLVTDNLNTHFSNAFYETFEPEEAKSILEKIEFHYTPNRRELTGSLTGQRRPKNSSWEPAKIKKS